ncbi:MAG: N4-gp56 family major capsid protein [Cellvibrionaceae bacterium]
MALTNFAALTTEEKTVWSRDFWKMARNMSFVNKFAGKGANSMVQRVTDLTKSEKGARAVLTLIADMEGDGVVGDYKLEDNEEAIKAYDTVINIDQLRNANRLAGRMADQKSVVTFRENSRDQLAYWAADRLDQMAFLSLAGVPYTKKNNGADRAVLATGQNLGDLEFAADVTAPSSARHLRWNSAGKSLEVGDTTSVTASDSLSYAALVELKAYAKEQYVRGIKSAGGEEVYHVFVTPKAMAKLKLDPDFLQNVRNAGVRGSSNSLFAGTNSVMVDGLMIHEYRHVFNTSGLAGGSKWGAGNVDGCRVSLCGAQALGMADIGISEWKEEDFDYGNQHGISIAKIFGFLKPQFHSNITGDKQDFGVINLDVAM